MPDEPNQLELTPPADPPVADPPPPPSEPVALSPEEELRALREDKARLEGENATLRELGKRPEAAPPPPVPAVPDLATADGVEKAYTAGDITESQRIRLLAKIEAKQELEQSQARDRIAVSADAAKKRLGEYITKYPALQDRTSPLLQRVSDELTTMASELGVDPQDPRVQVRAVEAVIAREGGRVDPHEFNRRRIPVGGPGGGTITDQPPPQPKVSKGEELFKRMTKEAQDWFLWQRNNDLAAVYKTLEFADEDKLRKAGRFTN